jgi:hypothetical protein
VDEALRGWVVISFVDGNATSVDKMQHLSSAGRLFLYFGYK